MDSIYAAIHIVILYFKGSCAIPVIYRVGIRPLNSPNILWYYDGINW